MEKKNLIVQLYVPTSENRGRTGTAYPVAKNVLLTAAHVIGDATGETVEARWWHQPDRDRGWRHCGRILWDGRKETPPNDVVLLSCEFPTNVASAWGTVAKVRPKDHVDWASEGFAFVGEKGSKPVPLQGKTHSMGDGSEHFHLQVRASTETEEGWQGASGSPVFVKESIIGVIVNSPRNFKAERFEAVPLFRLLEHEGFRSQVDYSEAVDQRQQLTDAAIDDLALSEAAMSALSKSLKLQLVQEKHEWARTIVHTLLKDTNPVKLASVIVRVQRQFGNKDDSQKRAVACLDAVAMHLIPATLATEHVQQIRVIADSSQQRYDFHAGTKTFVEMGMARLQGRRAQYRPPQNQRDLPPGILSLENPVEAEIDRDGKQFKRDFVLGLRDAITLGGLSDLADDGFDEAVDEINDELELRNSLGEGVHYYVFHIPENPDLRQRRLRIIRELDELFPLITFIGLEPGKGSSEERQCVRLVLRILCHSAGIEWKTDGQIETSGRSGQSD